MRERLAAFALDYMLIAGYLIALAIVASIMRFVSPDVTSRLFASALMGEATGFLLVTLPVSAYFVLSEASGRGATWGKRRRGLRVVAANGHRLSLVRSTIRTGLKFVPWELSHGVIWQFAFAGPQPPPVLSIALVVVWVLVGLNAAAALTTRRAVYDLVAGTVVMRTG